MSSAVDNRVPPEGRLQRLWAQWQQFWFTPADPTPLCLMRIVTGLLILYVHVAYSFDLLAFFGPNGWYGHEQANRERREWPNFAPQSQWEMQPRFRMPQIAEHRHAIRVFIENVASDAKRQPYVLDLFRNYMPSDDSSMRTELLNYLKRLPPDFVERNDELIRMVNAGAETAKADNRDDKPQQLIPAFLRGLPKERREQFSADANAFLDLLPPDRQLSNHIFAVFQSEGARDLSVLVDLIDPNGPPNRRPKLPTDPVERAAYLDYCERWTCPPDDQDIVVQGHAVYSPFYHIYDPSGIVLLHAAHLFVIVLFTIGFCTRVTSVLTWLAILAYIQRNPLTLFGQDTMMNLAMIYLMLSPCGEVWSVDWLIARYRAGRATLGSGHRPPDTRPRRLVSAGFALRLLQVQYCVMYLSAGLSKLKGESWWSGTATWLTMTNPEFSPLHIGLFRSALEWLCHDNNRVLWEIVMNAAVAFTLFLEIGLPFLIWTRMRPVMLAGAILLHFGIATNMGLIVFSLFMFVLLLAWMPPEAIRRVFAHPPASPKRLQLRYNAQEPRQVKVAAKAYALDVWGQVEFTDGEREAAQVVVEGEAATGYALARKLLSSLSMTQSIAWLLGLPGIAQLGHAVFNGGTTPLRAGTERDDSNRKRPGQKPIASR